MDYQVIWSREALKDVDNIAEYIAKDSPLYAQSVVEQLIIRSRKLSLLALRCRIVPELHDPNYRESLIHSYRMIYRVINNEVAIIAVIHGAQILNIDDRIETL
jgi:addiction module RelE/StbE family toxin